MNHNFAHTPKKIVQKKSHKNIVILVAIVLGVVWLLWKIISLFSGSVPEKTIYHKDLLSVPWPNEINFAGEKVPLDDFYVREEWEKQFLVLLSRDYQNLLYLKRSAKYFPFIEAELQKRNLPQDLKYLAVAESALREDSTSHANAAGIWQFIPSTAREYGLIVNDQVDERRNFEKATRAALDYLEKLHDIFGNWTLAAAAYNAGQGGIASTLSAQGVSDYYDLYLNSETASYLFRILAIKQIMQTPPSYGYKLSNEDYFYWPKYDYITVGKIDDLSTWSVEQGINLRTLKELNPWIVGTSLPEGSWRIKLYKPN